MIDLQKLFIDVFDPQPGEIALVLHDAPHGLLCDTSAWARRRAMAARWHAALLQLGARRNFRVLPLTSYPATGAHNAQLPEQGSQGSAPVRLSALASQATLVLALTQFSASAPLIGWTQRFPRLRVASLPTVAPEMEETALAADYAQVARSCALLRDRLNAADYARLSFSNGDKLTLDLRFRAAHVDDGQLHSDKAPPRLVNLPSGEAYQAIYEGERSGVPSATRGVLPVEWRGDVVRLEIDCNRVVDVLGRNEAADDLRNFLATDGARRNVAELGLGCNPKARVWGNVLEDEKAGPHIALGRSEHLGGVIGPDAFEDPRHVWHQDFVYTRECANHVAEMILLDSGGQPDLLVVNGRYVEALEVGI
ncbi:MAG TPA: aminopeptidase [Roseiflexaceae bacterium]